MRVDVLTIFPEYLAPLGLSLIGRAQADGLLSVHTHDLRDWTHDRHRTVDDTPYGGGPGMVMRPEPWGDAIDAVLMNGRGDEPGAAPVPTLVIPTPAGQRFDQRLAEELAATPWLIVACGRYEGIDQRVTDHFAERVEVLEISLGDYVLNGGEAAALVIVEAVARLLSERPRQPRVARRGVPRRRAGGRAARVPRLHQATHLARARRARGPAVRSSRPDRGLASRSVATTDCAAAGPTSPIRARP